uniref:XK-related protein n=1 Tax=Sinocyclocheilus rhinocerous TaxID=307959 RepID=A0A673H009_9TELE
MTNTGKRFTWFRWLCTVFGLLFYLADIGSDFLLSVQYFKRGHVTWAALTLVFVLVGSLCIQIFSYAWFKDDKENYEEDDKGLSTCHLISIHVLQIGIFTSNLTKVSLSLFLFIDISMAVSFLTIAWATVDYRRCFRRSLPNLKEMPSGIPTAVYLSYKIFTITPRILSLTLFIMLSTFNTVGMACIWLVGTVWAFVEETDFCTSRVVEYLYRTIVGVILLFTFFNIKGENAKVHMTVYYIFSVGQNLAAPILLFLLKPESVGTDYFLPIIFFILVSHSMGLGFLGLYYSLLHPHQPCREKIADEIDGIDQVDGMNHEPKTTRFERFLRI